MSWTRDHPRLAEAVVDERLAEEADDHGGDGRDDHDPGQASVLVVATFGPQRAEEPLRHRPEVLAEVEDDAGERADVEGDVERLVEVLVVAQEGVVLRPWDEDEVAR